MSGRYEYRINPSVNKEKAIKESETTKPSSEKQNCN